MRHHSVNQDSDKLVIIYLMIDSTIAPSLLQVYKAKIRAVYQVEKKIATRRNKLIKHYGKWERLLPHFSFGNDIGCLHAYLHVLFTLVFFLSCFVICYGDYFVLLSCCCCFFFNFNCE